MIELNNATIFSSGPFIAETECDFNWIDWFPTETICITDAFLVYYIKLLWSKLLWKSESVDCGVYVNICEITIKTLSKVHVNLWTQLCVFEIYNKCSSFIQLLIWLELNPSVICYSSVYHCFETIFVVWHAMKIKVTID